VESTLTVTVVYSPLATPGTRSVLTVAGPAGAGP
jgi:hypothetical protein